MSVDKRRFMKLSKKQIILVAVIAPILFLGGIGGGAFLVMQQTEKRLEEEAIQAEKARQEQEAAEAEKSKEAAVTLDDRFKNNLSQESLEKISQELAQWSNELKKREKNLIALDEDLVRREKLLAAEQEALIKRRESLAGLQKKLEERIITVQKTETESYTKLALFYSTMKPDTTLEILRAMKDDDVAKMFAFMPEKTRLKLMNAWSGKYPQELARVTKISEKFYNVVKEYEPLPLSGDVEPQTTPESKPKNLTENKNK
jgi:flagellar motility protein MotE (MotC chaperone)